MLRRLPLLDFLRAMPPEEVRAAMEALPPSTRAALRFTWRGLWARPDQLAPGSPGAAPGIRGRPGLLAALRRRDPIATEAWSEWTTWLLLGGRGAGKGRAGAEQVIEWAKRGRQPPIHLVGPTMADVRDVMVCETPQPGQSGIIAISEPGFVPEWFPSKRMLLWPNGAMALGFSADEPERLRGPQAGKAWADDVAAWKRTTRDAAWDMMMFGLRLGDRPQCVATTTPKPVPWLIGSRAPGGRPGMLHDPSVIITRARTADNRANLAAAFLSAVIAKYEGTRLGRQELDAEILTDIEGALWALAMFDAMPFRVGASGRAGDIKEELRAIGVEEFRRIVVAIDPQASDGTGETDQPESPETGIVVAAVAECRCKGEEKPENHLFILEDLSGSYSPHEWASVAIDAYERRRADRILGEKNNGGAMVEATIRSVSRAVPFSAVWASRGKRTRAEPIASLYEQGKAHHVGAPQGLARLEDQLTTWDGSGPSPNRLDALVWAATELMIESEETASDWMMRLPLPSSSRW